MMSKQNYGEGRCEACNRALTSDDRFRNNADSAAILVEKDLAIDESKQRIVFALTNILAGVILRSTLTDQDVACINLLAAILFHTAILWIRIATVAG